MKSLGVNHVRHLSDSCAPQEPLCPLTQDAQGTYLLSPAVNHYGTLDPHLHHFAPTSPTTLQPLNNQLSNSSTFPRLHFTSQPEQGDYPQQGFVAQTGSQVGSLATSMSMGMGLGLGLGGAPLITSGTATISSAAAAKMNRLPASLLDQLERHLPLQRDGFSTLQFHRRSRSSKQRSESPGRIRHLVHSVQKLFAKTQSLETSAMKGNIPGDRTKTVQRSKSKDRNRTEGCKQPNISGFWSSDDGLDEDVAIAAATNPPSGGAIAVAYRNPLSMMTLGRMVSDSQAPPRHHPQGYNTIAAHSLKASKSSGDLKCQTGLQVGGGEVGSGGGGGGDSTVVKRGSWSTLTLSHAKQVFQKGSATVNRTLLKTKSCHQDLTSHYLQVPLGDCSGTMNQSRNPNEIPCRRIRSGSYVKAMGDEEHSEDSEGSPKPSPKTAARRQSYLKATQQSLSEQQQPPTPRNCLPSLRELSANRSLDNLDCLMSQSDWSTEGGFGHGFTTLARGSGISQVDAIHKYEQSYTNMAMYEESDSQAVEALDLPMPTCFRSRSHSYLRAIQAGCSQDDDTASADSDELLPVTISTCINTCKKTPPPVPPRTASKPFISVTVQSSTESAQDTYLDGQDPRSEVNSQSGRSNSSDSLSSVRTGSLAKGSCPLQLPVATPVDPPPPSSSGNSQPSEESKNESVTPRLTVEEPKSEAIPKRKLSSIGIQVDCIQPIQREEPVVVARFQSVGVQVEDGRPLSRFTSMASRQETTEAESQDQPDDKPSDNCTAQNKASVASSADCSSADSSSKAQSGSSLTPESLDPALDPSSLPPPDPSLENSNASGVNGEQTQSGGQACLRDGHWFLKLLEAETGRMEGWCGQMDKETKDKQLSEEVLGKIRSAVGSAQLIMSQKFQQFRGLCEENLNVDAKPRPTPQDLAGFWDLLQLSIEDISMKFDELHQLRSNNWQLPEAPDKKEETKQPPPPVPKKPIKTKSPGGKEKSGDSGVDKQRQEARKRLLAAKRAVSERQNSATESADSIEIYVPEAQTRL
ncbi:disks large-associated protein 4 isoform X1 [Chanos chanos]|uniref:Disks large-associated protein 4 isoform X1 n=1 Tax=Chanos chanos TaxID=29144 RepID=A0A6J2WD88_CHACN|nr:disks large-associated protein 4-like isoform X1 [Chanos chanos]